MTVSCHSTEELIPEKGAAEKNKLTIVGSRSGTMPAEFENVSAFLFSSGKEYDRRTINFSTGGEITVLDFPSFYFFSGRDFPSHSPGITEQELVATKLTHGASAETAPDFYVAKASAAGISAAGKELAVEMKHGVARIDLNANSGTKIGEVRLLGAPSETYPFQEGVKASDGKVDYVKRFDTPYSGENTPVFMVFETDSPITVKLTGTYNDIPVAMQVSIPAILRNKVYTVKVLEADNVQNITFTVKEWEAGDTVEVRPSVRPAGTGDN